MVVTSPTQSPFFIFIDEKSSSLFHSSFIEAMDGIDQTTLSNSVESARAEELFFA
jgi:hypothetical protein